eukprot:m.176706 g.176706  ORF g.176706 m.176706 type:complete len:273 (-) comp16804_c1_seq2:2286-3104(-)
MAYNRLVAAWESNDIDEVDFVHMEDITVFEGCKLAVPYALLTEIASIASQHLSRCFTHPITAETSLEALRCSLGCLTVNGNNYAAWNIRKTAVALCTTANWQSELAITAALLTKHSKSACGWSHRRWILQQLFPTTVGASFSQAEFETEWQLCELAAERYPKNYYAWSHRVWLWQTYGQNRLELAQADLERTRIWTSTHLADYSGYHHAYVMTKALSDGGFRPEAMKAEVAPRVDYYQQRNTDYPNHGALQQHLQRLKALLNHLKGDCEADK